MTRCVRPARASALRAAAWAANNVRAWLARRAARIAARLHLAAALIARLCLLALRKNAVLQQKPLASLITPLLRIAVRPRLRKPAQLPGGALAPKARAEEGSAPSIARLPFKVRPPFHQKTKANEREEREQHKGAWERPLARGFYSRAVS